MEKIVNKSKPSEEKIVELVEVPCGRTSTISTPAQVSQNKDQDIEHRYRTYSYFKMSGLVARIFRPALRTLQPKTFPLTLQKRFKQAKPTYDFPESSIIFPEYASMFQQKHLDALRVDRDILKDEYFNVENLEIEDDCVRTFVDKLHDVIEIPPAATGTSDSMTDTLINDLLVRVVNFDNWPFKVKLEPPLKLFITNGSVSASPEFVVNKKNIAFICVEDKHFKNKHIYSLNGFGEYQLAAEILACGYENMLEDYVDQEIFALRVISTYVTFYRAKIPASYWKEIVVGLPKKQSIVIKRWPKENNRRNSSLNLAEPSGRKTVITDLIKIRQYLLKG
ncbi:561_t:CDS:2 [Rhizophagus irregularis]|nr:561_t:CDS:2 [Rhizophagus irregularis]